MTEYEVTLSVKQVTKTCTDASSPEEAEKFVLGL